MNWRRIHLCTGVLERAGRLLLVASRYANHAEPLWNLPGGRQEPLESCSAAVAREFREETSLTVRVGTLVYVAESFDRTTATHFTNFAFAVTADGEPSVPANDPHAVACEWVARADLRARLSVAVVREPLLAYLDDPTQRFFSYPDAGITIDFGPEMR